jgi:lipooligosaccharide transport system permease protein
MSIMSVPVVRSYAYWLAQYRRTWRVMYLAAMGVGLGSLVKSGRGTDGLTYLQFVAPGLLAATAMQIGAGEATYPVLGSFKWIRNYHAMAATPLTPVDIAVGHLMWMASRVGMACGIYLGIVAAFGALRTPFAILALPVCILLGLAFAAPIAAYAATREIDNGFAALQRFGIVPMFLFSGAFFNVSQLPSFIRPIAYATPLWHGVRLTRDLTTGHLEPGGLWLVAAHLLYLLVLTGVGILFVFKHFRARLAV